MDAILLSSDHFCVMKVTWIPIASRFFFQSSSYCREVESGIVLMVSASGRPSGIFR